MKALLVVTKNRISLNDFISFIEFIDGEYLNESWARVKGGSGDLLISFYEDVEPQCTQEDLNAIRANSQGGIGSGIYMDCSQFIDDNYKNVYAWAEQAILLWNGFIGLDKLEEIKWSEYELNEQRGLCH